ncbi:MAG: KH domain-containing protein [Candidatus Hermodarchaeota archaeon]
MKQELIVPKSRIAVIIGPNGTTKALLEQQTQTSIHIDSQDGAVTIEADTEINPDPMAVWIARDIIRAIGRGFSPKTALNLLEEDIYFDLIDLKGTPKQQKRIRGRIIGEGGKTRQIIEETTKVKIAIFGGTVSFIGDIEAMNNAKEAVTMLMDGARHSTVYRHLSNLRFREKLKPPELWETDIE